MKHSCDVKKFVMGMVLGIFGTGCLGQSTDQMRLEFDQQVWPLLVRFCIILSCLRWPVQAIGLNQFFNI